MRIKAFLLGILCVFFSITAFAAEGDPAGQVIIVSGPFSVVHADNVRVMPKRGDMFYSGDTLITGKNGTAQVRFTDGGVLALSPNSALKVNEYHYDKSSSDKSVTTLVKGGFRAITGLIAKEDPSAYKIQSPIAVIGVRGTNLGAVLSRGKLFTGVWKGGISVQNQYGSINLGEGQDYNYAETSLGHAPVGLLNPPAELIGQQCQIKPREEG